MDSMMDISNEQLWIYLFHYDNYYRTHCFQVCVFTIGYRLIVCPYTLYSIIDTMNSNSYFFSIFLFFVNYRHFCLHS